MAHHYSGQDCGFPDGDARLDLTGLCAFRKPAEVSKTILIMNAHPSYGVNPPGRTTDEPFAREAIDELKIDTDGGAAADIALYLLVSASVALELIAVCPYIWP